VTRRASHADLAAFLNKIESTEALVSVVGLGYVGLPVALSFAQAGFRVHGVDVDESRIQSLEARESYLGDVASEQIADLMKASRFSVGSDYSPLAEADAILISVPTPLSEGTPDLSRVVACGKSLAAVLKPNSLIVLESTTYPGTTQELLVPLLEECGMTAGEDFYLAFSPERIDPGNPIYDFNDIPKVVGGVNEASTKAASRLYESVLPKVFTVSSPKEAELSKLIENTFRHVNIALVNELAVYAHDMGVDIWESIEAAATKPFGFMPFWPGPGWGGHCIPLDPAYLSYRVRKDRAHEVRFVELAHAVNAEMPRHVVERSALLLNGIGKAVRGSKILGVGIAYKGGTEDMRGSAAIKVLNELKGRGAEVCYHDPLVPEIEMDDRKLRSVEITSELFENVDLTVIFVDQLQVNWEILASGQYPVLDCCNALRVRSPKIERL
jgi:UDP-N-acetyl-D-glucosamine dehydrogenase